MIPNNLYCSITSYKQTFQIAIVFKAMSRSVN